MNKFLGIALIVLGAFFFLKILASAAFLLLLLAAGLAIGASSGAIGRWGYGGAILCLALLLPALAARTFFAGIAMLGWLVSTSVHLLPLLLILYGIYVLAKAFR